MKNQKGFSTIVIVIAIVAVLVALGFYLVSQKDTNLYNKGGQQVTQTQQPATSAIQNSSDLDATATDLDNTNVDEVDNELNQIDADASTF
ncbi:MAG: hypothetical protein UU67_C0016G0003 [Candidatus Daviesbacteria bacterium GW2011_GWB1_41_5]|uniref:Uncharacterized protein n=1 Tax=Candidatus Daviesbacteria bacterium GW2011_GWB1_41_5 TaxID=1618429 RepID=A0A0G0WLX3_9BACT|nr:MAG: hypothetical protein UU67_C0016G0003 [Candidatus Daviesbacteria bacterium GW2011_GWB1_41_5]